MCRIFGFVGKVKKEKRPLVGRILRGLILAEEANNPDGTGVVIKTLPHGHNVMVKKGIRGKAYLVRGYADFLQTGHYYMALGHVRKKTKGKVSDRNSHPFGYKIKGRWYYGVHNGSIPDANKLAKEYGVKPAKVDSETFYRCLAKMLRDGADVVEAIEELTYKISDTGEFAFAYMTPKEIYLWRNERRPLTIFDFRPVGLGRFFASTKTMMEKALRLATPKASKKFSKTGGFEAKPYRLYRMSLDDNCEVEPVKDLKRKERPIPVRSSWSSWGYKLTDYSDYIDDIYGVTELTEEQIEQEIFNVELELENPENFTSEELYWEMKDYLNALKREKRRREARRYLQKVREERVKAPEMPLPFDPMDPLPFNSKD